MTSKTPLCCKNLWVLFSGTHLIKSQDYINLILEENSDKILKGILFYKKRDNNSTEDIKSILKQQEINDIPSHFLEKLSVLIDLNVSSACHLFISYLLHDFKGTPKSVKILFKNENSIQSLLHSLWDYYYSERLFSLFCMKEILSNWYQSSRHPYYVLFDDFIAKNNDDDTIFKYLIGQLEICLTAEIPNRQKNGNYLTNNLITNWVENNTRELLHILQILLLYFKSFNPKIECLINMLALFQDNGFGNRFNYGSHLLSFIGSEQSALFKLIGFFESLIIVVSFQLDTLFNCIEADSNDHYLLKNSEKLRDLDQLIIENCTNLQEYSPILLAWMLVRSWDLPGLESNADLVVRLGSFALKQNVFGYLVNSLENEKFQDIYGSSVSRTVKEIVGNLIAISFSIYSVEAIGNKIDILYKLASLIMDDNDVARILFSKPHTNGLMSIFESSCLMFPQNLIPFLSICASLASTTYSNYMIEKVTCLKFFTELFSQEVASSVRASGQNQYQLINDRKPFAEDNFVLLKNTFGTIHKLNPADDSIFITWRVNEVDALKVMANIFHDHVRNYRNNIYANGSMEDLIFITKFCSAIIEKHPQFYSNVKDIVNKAFQAFKSISKLQEIPIRLIAAILDLFAILIKTNAFRPSVIWELISECALFPYMIGLTKEESELISGQDTNSSRIGEALVSTECIEGSFELCCAYLNFISITLPTDDQIASASLIYITNEIFSCYYHWHYKRIIDYKYIGRKCLDIFNKVLSEQNFRERKQLLSICKTALLCGPAGQTLLHIIVNGQELVRKAIENNGSSQVLENDGLIVMVRGSLSVLNRLLLLQESEKDRTLSNTAVEQALFSTNSTKSNMILVLSHYVFQRYDTHLATLAVMLLKRLSKHFPMSMLACLGSEGESIRDHFLYRLEEITEDLQLKIALLGFLSSCIKHQPGLIEMFLNLESNDSSENNSTCSCLKTVLEILEEKMLSKYYCPRDLHLAAVKFVFTFWLQPHLLAIDSLKKNVNMWKLVCFPFVEMSDIDERIFGYILKLLAREIFYSKSLKKENFDKPLEEIFVLLGEKEHLIKLSNFLKEKCDSFVEEKNDVVFLLQSWRDFLVSISKFEPFLVSHETKYIITSNIMASLHKQLSSPDKINNSLILLLTDILMILLKRWNKNGISSANEWIAKATDVLYIVNEQKEILTIGFLISVCTVLDYSMEFFEDCDLLFREKIKNWITPWCGIFGYCAKILEKYLMNIEDSSDIKLSLCILVLSLLQNLIIFACKTSLWLPVIRRNLVLENMVSLLCCSIECKKGLQLSRTLLSTFILLSTIPETANLLQTIQVIESINDSLVRSKPSEGNAIRAEKNYSWLQVFELTLQLNTSLLITLKHHFASVAINFVINHSNEITNCLSSIRNSPFSDLIGEATHIISLFCDLTHYKQYWVSYDLNSYELLVMEISKTCNSLIAYILRPGLLQHLLNHPSISINFSSSTSVFKMTGDAEKSAIKLNGDNTNFELHGVLFQLLSRMLLFLHNVNPNLVEILSMIKLKSNSMKLKLDPSIGAPNIDPNKIMSLGSLLNCLSLCIRMLSKIEKISSSTESSCDQFSKTKILFTLETTLSLLVSQALLAQYSPSINEREKQIIGRELKTELNSMLSIMSRHTKRTISGSSIHSVPRSPGSLLERPFINSLLHLVEITFK